MNRHFARRLSAWVLMLALLQASSTSATDFVVRQVTNLGNPVSGMSASSVLGVVNDRLVFLAGVNGVTGLYRTDGTTTELITSPVNIETDEVAVVNNQMFVIATGPDGKELYSTDGLTLRQVTDIAAGSLSSSPNRFITLNGQLLFRANNGIVGPSGFLTSGFYHTDGTTVQEFPYDLSLAGSVRLGNQLVYGGRIPGSNEPAVLTVTDGVTLTNIATPPLGIVPMAKVGNHAYFIAGQGTDLGIHRTDGTVAELVTTLDSFTTLDNVISLFENDHQLALMMQDTANKQLVFYRSIGSTPTEVLRWSIPSISFSLTPPLDGSHPIFSADTRAYFQFRSGNNQQLYVFDGASFNLLVAGNPTTDCNFTELNNRLFLNVNSPTSSTVTALYEVVNGTLVPRGTGLNTMVAVQGEIIGANTELPISALTTPLWQLRDGALASLGSYVARNPFDTDRFTEFGNQLYFSGQTGNNRQIYALVPVPEPTALALVSVAAAAVLITRSRRHSQRV